MIRREPLEKILRGNKTWEIRTRATKVRGRIGLSEKGAGQIVGTVIIAAVVGPLSLDQVLSNARKMGLQRGEIEADLHDWRTRCGRGRVFAWVFASVRRLRRPVPFQNPSGAVTWARVPPSIAKRL